MSDDRVRSDPEFDARSGGESGRRVSWFMVLLLVVAVGLFGWLMAAPAPTDGDDPAVALPSVASSTVPAVEITATSVADETPVWTPVDSGAGFVFAMPDSWATVDNEWADVAVESRGSNCRCLFRVEPHDLSLADTERQMRRDADEYAGWSVTVEGVSVSGHPALLLEVLFDGYQGFRNYAVFPDSPSTPHTIMCAADEPDTALLCWRTVEEIASSYRVDS